jgi:acetylornithine deacetylase/succinyl-diaminopimelate desuccinylase-like protein
MGGCEDYPGRFVVACVADEERGSHLGLQYLVREGLATDVDYAVIPDTPDHIRTISVSEKALLFIRITSHGRQAHGSSPDKGVNAITNMARLLDRLERLDLSAASHPLHSPATMNVGTMSGGTAPNIVPASCQVQLDVRYLPGQDIQDVLSLFEQTARQLEEEFADARFDVEVIDHMPPFEVSTEGILVSTTSDVCEAVLGTRPDITGNSGTTVAKQFVAAGVETIAISPGDPSMPHTSNECIELDELCDFANILVRLARELSH